MRRLPWLLIAAALIEALLLAYVVVDTPHVQRPMRNVYHPFTVELSVHDR